MTTQTASQVLNELPRDAAGSRSPRRRPFQVIGVKRLALDGEVELARVSIDHGQIVVLAALIETEPKPEPVR